MDAHIPLIVDRSGTILNLTFNNPSKKNALNSEMMGAMTAAIEESSNYEELRAIVIRGEGSIFCSGADINTWEPEQLQLLLKTSTECSIPTIAEAWASFVHATLFYQKKIQNLVFQRLE